MDIQNSQLIIRPVTSKRCLKKCCLLYLLRRDAYKRSDKPFSHYTVFHQFCKTKIHSGQHYEIVSFHRFSFPEQNIPDAGKNLSVICLYCIITYQAVKDSNSFPDKISHICSVGYILLNNGVSRRNAD